MSDTAALPPVTLVLGGARSGKSRHAERLVESAGRGLYVATAEVRDGEMAARVAEHRARRGPSWTTVEVPVDLAGCLAGRLDGADAVLVDCLTLWLANLMAADIPVSEAADRLLAALPAARPVVFVSNEVGLGIVPDNALARAFRDHAGALHQRLAARADRVLLMVAGLPLTVK